MPEDVGRLAPHVTCISLMLSFPSLLQLPPAAPLWEPQLLVPSLAPRTLSDMRFTSLVPGATTSPAQPLAFARTTAPGVASALFAKVRYNVTFGFNLHVSHPKQNKPQVVLFAVTYIIRWWQLSTCTNNLSDWFLEDGLPRTFPAYKRIFTPQYTGMVGKFLVWSTLAARYSL